MPPRWRLQWDVLNSTPPDAPLPADFARSGYSHRLALEDPFQSLWRSLSFSSARSLIRNN